MPEDAPAITTQYESLWIGTSFAYGNLKEIKWVVSAPELSATPPRVDATHFCSEQRTYVVGLPDYAVDMEWVCNCQASANPGGNLALLMSLDPDTVYCVERRLYAAGVNVRIRGRVSWALSGASVNGIQQVTIKVTPEADLTVVPVEAYQGKATVYYAGSIVGGAAVMLDGSSASSYDVALLTYGPIPSRQTVKSLAQVGSEAQPSLSLAAPAGYSFGGWCEDPIGEGRTFQPGDRVFAPYAPLRLYPVLVPEEAVQSLSSPAVMPPGGLLTGGLDLPAAQELQAVQDAPGPAEEDEAEEGQEGSEDDEI